MKKIRDIKGMKDVFEAYPVYNHILNRSRPILENLGYQRLIQNVVERQETFTRTLGVSSDIVQKEMYAFKDLGENELVLRPEGTAGAIRQMLNTPNLMQFIEKEPVKMWYWGPMYRYERPQAGRLR